jgi:hypothetical protein
MEDAEKVETLGQEESQSSSRQQQRPEQHKVTKALGGGEKPFALKKWNLVATWAWDVECDTCAICRVHLMGKFGLREWHFHLWE